MLGVKTRVLQLAAPGTSRVQEILSAKVHVTPRSLDFHDQCVVSLLLDPLLVHSMRCR